MQSTAGAGRDQEGRQPAARLIARVRIPEEMAVGGPVRAVVRPRLLETSATQALAGGGISGESVWLTCGGCASQLIVEPPLAVGLVSRALGLAAPALGGPLTRIERGVLLGVLSEMLSRQALSPEVRLSEEGQVAAIAELTGIALSVDLGGQSGQAWLLATSSLLDALCARQGDGFARLELATTTIPGSDLATAVVGDRIVFESSAPSTDDAWTVTLCCQERSCPARWRADGLVVPAEGREAADTVRGRRADLEGGSGHGPPAAGIAIAAWTAEPLARLAWGDPLVIPRSRAVVLCAAGTVWGEGQMGESDGALAITITRLLSG
jgi:hypothetical protein